MLIVDIYLLLHQDFTLAAYALSCLQTNIIFKIPVIYMSDATVTRTVLLRLKYLDENGDCDTREKPVHLKGRLTEELMVMNQLLPRV